MASKKKICSAIEMQEEISKLFRLAIEKDDLKTAGYLAQIWISCETHAKEERKVKSYEHTSIDDLVEILKDCRSKFNSE